MKRFIILTPLLFWIFVAKSQFHAGIETGFGMNSVSASNVDARLKMSEKVGCYINYSVGKDDFYETGVSFIRKGYDLIGFIPQYTNEVKELDIRMDCIEVPLMIGYNYKISEKQNIRVIYKTGIYLSWGIQGEGILSRVTSNHELLEERVENVFKNETFVENDHIYDYIGFNKFDIGAKVGIDFIIKKFTLRVNYAYGFKDMHPAYDKHIKNMALDLSFGYNFW